MMSRLLQSLPVLVLIAAVSARGGTGWVELRQADMPAVIEQAGTYRLVENLSLDQGATHGITINVPDVHLDLNGFVLSGAYDSTLDGIHIAGTANNVVVENGTVANWGEDGIDAGVDAYASTGCVFRALHVTGNAFEGLEAGRSALVRDCVAMANGRYNADADHEEGSGILVGQGSLVQDCVVYENHGHGILARSGSVIQDCLIHQNDHDGIHAGQSTVVLRCSVQGQRANGDGIEVDGSSVIIDSISCGNADDGIKTRSTGRALIVDNITCFNGSDGINLSGNACLVMRNSSVDNADDGINVNRRTLVLNNNSHGNGFIDPDTPGGGVRAENGRSRIQGNHCYGNEIGIEALGIRNVVTGNSALDNTLNDFNGLENNQAGNVTDDPQGAGPWDNLAF